MRRTYKSKKDTTSVIERRDLFQNLDDKSAAYNAFSIQNIKQTKRELSCVGSSNPLGVASSKVRKKKYVKRIVKDVEIPCREISSVSTYLTPDKSIRVNKPLDPFDLLLISSPAGPVEATGKEVESVTSKVNLFDQLISKKEGRAYTRRKPNKTKKINYSSNESYDTEKENSDDRPNVTQNTSDIRTHDLLVERVFNNKPKITDDSINNIVNNLSLLNKLKHKYSSNDSINKSLILNRHRLTKNILSPLSQKSPLCSTPFKVKYRGDSIFKFSPISATSKVTSPKHESLTEGNDDSNCSVVLLGTVKDNIEEKTQNLSPNNSPKIEENNEPDYQKETYVEEEALSHKILEVPNLVPDEISSVEINSLQTTEMEPFLGFSNDTNTEKVIDYGDLVVTLQDLDGNILKREVIESFEVNDEMGDSSMDDIEIAQNTRYYEYDLNGVNNNNYINNPETTSVQSTDEDRGSLYDTCTSEQSSIMGRIVNRKPVVLLERINDTLFHRYYDVMKFNETDSDDIDTSVNTESGSFEDCNDLKESSSSSSHIGSHIDDNALENKTEYNSEDIESNDDAELNSNSEEIESNGDVELNSTSEEIESNDDAELNSNSEEIESKDDAELNSHSEEIESNDDAELNGNNEEEKCISFVTTRRRHGVANNSMLSMFNDSNYSSSSNCDNTVLSNYIETKPDAKDLDNDVERSNKQCEEDDEIIDLNKDSEHLSEGAVEEDTTMSFVTTRSSNITDRKSSIKARKSSIKPKSDACIGQSDLTRDSIREESRMSCFDGKPGIVLQPGKKWERSLSIYRRMTMMTDQFDRSILEDEPMEAKGRRYRQSVISTMEMQEFNSSLHNESINSRRSTFVSKPNRSTIRIVKQDANSSRLSLCNTTLLEDLKGFWNEECDDTIIELSKLSITDHTHEVTVLDNFHDTSNRIVTAKDYVLRRCNQTEPILFDECYPDLLLKNCHKIGEGVYGEVYLWRDRDGRARVLKIVPIAGSIKVNGESQKDFHEIISEIVIAMELSALRAPIAEIERHFDEGKDVEALDLHAIENATDVFNEVLAVRCVYGSYPSRLLDLWDLYDECKGSENDNPAILPVDQQYIVLELANAGQDLESYQFNNAEQAHALFLQVAYGLAVAEEAFQFEHRDLHWGNVLIAPTEQKYATFVIRGRAARVARCGVRATVIDYSLSRVALRLGGPGSQGESAELYNDLAADESLFDAVGDYQFQVYRLMREKLGNDWKNFEPYTNILWLHYTVDKMITALRYKRTNTKIHKHYIDKLKGIKSRILDYGSAAQFVLTDNEI